MLWMGVKYEVLLDMMARRKKMELYAGEREEKGTFSRKEGIEIQIINFMHYIDPMIWVGFVDEMKRRNGLR